MTAAPRCGVTENGSAFEDPPAGNGVVEDPERTAFLQRHLEALSRAVADGVDVRRYHVWSLLDNFEWEHGYARRFGIVHVDYPTQRRTLKRSGHWYRDFIAVTRARRCSAGCALSAHVCGGVSRGRQSVESAAPRRGRGAEGPSSQVPRRP